MPSPPSPSPSPSPSPLPPPPLPPPLLLLLLLLPAAALGDERTIFVNPREGASRAPLSPPVPGTGTVPPRDPHREVCEHLVGSAAIDEALEAHAKVLIMFYGAWRSPCAAACLLCGWR